MDAGMRLILIQALVGAEFMKLFFAPPLFAVFRMMTANLNMKVCGLMTQTSHPLPQNQMNTTALLS